MIGTLKKTEQEYNKLQQKNLEWLKKQTILNIISARGIIFTYYKNKQQQERESYEQKKTIQTR